jgi:hypothetical protein
MRDVEIAIDNAKHRMTALEAICFEFCKCDYLLPNISVRQHGADCEYVGLCKKLAQYLYYQKDTYAYYNFLADVNGKGIIDK